MNKKDLRCIHRHTIVEHPQCFQKGLIRYQDVKEFEKYTGKPWYTFPGYKIGYFDIEVDNLNADYGTVLTWAIKTKDGDIKYDVITRDELFSPFIDRRITKSFVDAISEYKIVIGYYSTGFDMPFMRAKALHFDLDFPGYGEIFHWDLYYTVKSKLKISRRSLANACDYLGIKGKTPIDSNIWRLAKYGDPKSLEQVLEHNIADVVITEQLHDKLDFTRKWIKTSI